MEAKSMMKHPSDMPTPRFELPAGTVIQRATSWTKEFPSPLDNYSYVYNMILELRDTSDCKV